MRELLRGLHYLRLEGSLEPVPCTAIPALVYVVSVERCSPHHLFITDRLSPLYPLRLVAELLFGIIVAAMLWKILALEALYTRLSAVLGPT